MSTRSKLLLLFVAFLVAFALLAVAQQPTQESQKVIKHVPVKPTSPASGEEMYVAYCAVCHGKDLKGAGPAASALKVPPTNLTTLTQRNSGKFPFASVASTIKGDTDIAAHGTKDMPVWGNLFWRLSEGHAGEVHQRITNLSNYIESKQSK
jgi:mono/diheme cytochrome c family protein